MTNEHLTLKLGDAPVTKPGIHVTPEGEVIGAELEVEWEGPGDERTPTVTEVDGIPVVASGGAAPPAHPNERTAFVSPSTHEDLRKDAGLGGGGPPRSGTAGAAAPAVTTAVDGEGNKRTVEHEFSVNMSVDATDAAELRRLLEESAEEALEQAKRQTPKQP